MADLYYLIPPIALMSLNFPVAKFIIDIRQNKDTCKCSNNWKLTYLYYVLLFGYATGSLQILMTFFFPNVIRWFSKSSYAFSVMVVSLFSYSLYIMILWAYVEHLKYSICDCSAINDSTYVRNYTWVVFLAYLLLMGYVFFTLGAKAPKPPHLR